jgi:hypothetical protein
MVLFVPLIFSPEKKNVRRLKPARYRIFELELATEHAVQDYVGDGCPPTGGVPAWSGRTGFLA